MRHKIKKEALDTIVQKMVNDTCGKYLADLLNIAQMIRANKNATSEEILQTANWMYGYENELEQTLESIKKDLEKKIFNKEASHVTIMSGMVCYIAAISILDTNFDDANWETLFEECENKRISECVETLQRYCPEKIDVDGFSEARRYIRMWDSAFNW